MKPFPSDSGDDAVLSSSLIVACSAEKSWRSNLCSTEFTDTCYSVPFFGAVGLVTTANITIRQSHTGPYVFHITTSKIVFYFIFRFFFSLLRQVVSVHVSVLPYYV